MNIINKIFKNYEYVAVLFTKNVEESLTEVFVVLDVLGAKCFKSISWDNANGKIILKFESKKERDTFIDSVEKLDVNYYGTATYKCFA